MRDFKKFTSGEIRRKLEADEYLSELESLRYKYRKQKIKVWQDRFDDVALYSRKVLETKLNYIHENPVKKGFVKFAEEYKYSCAAYYKL
jgi:putative transposase